MSVVSSFSDGARVAVVGASGAIGRALAERLAAEPRVATVYAVSRSRAPFAERDVLPVVIDIEDEASVVAAAESCANDGPLDLVIVATGILHQGASIQPEKRMQDIDATNMTRVFALNCIGPTLVAKHFLPKMRAGSKTVFAALSARVGSISDNRLGGWASYRVSKAALNGPAHTVDRAQPVSAGIDCRGVASGHGRFRPVRSFPASSGVGTTV